MKKVNPFNMRNYLLLALFLVPVLLLFAQRLYGLVGQQSEPDNTNVVQSRVDIVCNAEEKLTDFEACKWKARTEKHRLFDELMLQPSLVEFSENGGLRLPSKDFLLAARAKGETLDKMTRSLVARLYDTIAGKAVQQQVAWWNHSRRFSAVRDNVRQKGTASTWVAKDNISGVRDGHSNVPLDYGIVNAGKIPQHFNDWLSVTGQDKIIFQRQVDPKVQRKVMLQVIGTPDVSALKPHKVIIEACESGKNKKAVVCKRVANTTTQAEVYRLYLTLASNQSQTLSLPVSPAHSKQLNLDGLSIHINQKKSKPEVPQAIERQQYAWMPLRPSAAGGRGNRDVFNYTVATARGTELFDSIENKPSNFTRDQGLLSLVGYESQDRLSLAGQLSRAKLDKSSTEVRLTIDDDLQRNALKHLEEQLKIIDPSGKYDDERRAAVVFLRPETGAILAASSYPNPPSDVNRWDRLSFSKLYPTKDKFSVHAWQGLDNNNTPGSVFKIVTSLAALKAAEEGDTNVRQMIRGLKPRAFKQLTGMSVTSSSYQAKPGSTSLVRNASNAPLLRAMPHKNKEGKTVRPPLRSTQGEGCPAKSVLSKDLGMRESIRNSLNTWFVRTGVMMDEGNLETGGKDTQLAKMAEQLNFGQKLPLAQLGTPLNPAGKLTNHKGRGSVLSAFMGDLTLRTNSNGLYAKGDALQRLSQNSFGQGVATTPLQMARVSTLVATGGLPQPYLLDSWNGKKLESPESKQLSFDDIDLLRAGMKAVPEVGTARAAFKKYFNDGKCRTYGKTGTAQVRGGANKSSRYSAWFTGWFESEDGTPEVSFACMVTHTYIYGKSYGGEVCGPIIARTLRDMVNKRRQQGAS